jgi:hypothetical protein
MRLAALATLLLLCACGSSKDTHHDSTAAADWPRKTEATTPAREAAVGGEAGGGVDAKKGGEAGVKPDGGNTGTKVGDPCTAATKCPAGGSGKAACQTAWPDGYCVVDGCSQHGHDCPGDPGQNSNVGDSKCVLAPTAACLKLCTTQADCRSGYTCAQKSDAAGHGQVQVCVPK